MLFFPGLGKVVFSVKIKVLNPSEVWSMDAFEETRTRQLAESLGLTRLTPEHLKQLHKAATVSAARRGALDNAALTPADEPAHVFRLP